MAPDSLSGNELDHLLAIGWYRMHQTLFTCSHVELGELYRVHWLRYHIDRIAPRSTHKRIKARAKEFTFSIDDFTEVRDDHRALHARYRASIDFDGAISIEDCLFGDSLTGNNIFRTKTISVFDKDSLVAGAYFDLGARAAASILHFYDPAYARFSLGKLLILLTIDYLRENNFDFYYPGYVVEGLDKMNYKLFLGKEHAEYFDPLVVQWKPFRESILTRSPELDKE
jgi:arginine-tRNA-protein transferase